MSVTRAKYCRRSISLVDDDAAAATELIVVLVVLRAISSIKNYTSIVFFGVLVPAAFNTLRNSRFTTQPMRMAERIVKPTPT
jgi:hypothetical protein